MAATAAARNSARGGPRLLRILWHGTFGGFGGGRDLVFGCRCGVSESQSWELKSEVTTEVASVAAKVDSCEDVEEWHMDVVDEMEEIKRSAAF